MSHICIEEHDLPGEPPFPSRISTAETAQIPASSSVVFVPESAEVEDCCHGKISGLNLTR